MNQFEKYFLTDNPFSITPAPHVEIWADRDELKKEVENLLMNMLASTPSKLAACFWGDWGTGKTHMSSYFSRPGALKKYSVAVGVNEPFSLHMFMPIRDIIDSLYFGILDTIGVTALKKTIESILPRKVSSPQANIDRLMPLLQDRNLAVAFLGPERLLEAYLYQTATVKELKQLGVPRELSIDSDKLKVLRAVFNLVTQSNSRIIIWLDDVERIGEISGKDISEFQVFFRDLLDYVPNNLNIVMLFTLTPGQKVEDMLSYVGDALRSRIYHVIQVQDMTRTEFVKYVTDMLSFFRVHEGEKKIDEYFPIKSRAVLEYVFKRMQAKDVELKRKGRSGQLTLTPRNINNILSQLLEMGLRDPKVRTIDNSMVDELMARF